jgi:hypothetical protein
LGAARYLPADRLAAIESHLGWSVATDPPRPAGPYGLACPACRSDMVERSFGESSPVQIDTCRACHGIWLDAGELLAIQLVACRRGALPSANLGLVSHPSAVPPSDGPGAAILDIAGELGSETLIEAVLELLGSFLSAIGDR